MKTAEQVVNELLDSHSIQTADGFQFDDMVALAIAAVEADRKQRAENTLTIELDDEHRPEVTVEEVLSQIEQGMTSGYYPMWEMNYIAPEGD